MSHRVVTKLATAKQQKEGGGFLVRRAIGSVIPTCDPFLLLDHMGPVDCKPGEALGAPDHPHRGFETVSYIIDGSLCHHDSAGNKGHLEAGWVQWMTAGSGVVHAEMPSKQLMEKGGRVEAFQLWVNLPAKDKMSPPRYQDTPPSKIPHVKSEDGQVDVKIIAGECLGAKASIETKIPILFLDIHLPAGSLFSQMIPAEHCGFVYVWKGAGFLGESKLPAHMGQVGILSESGELLQVQAEHDQDCHILLITGVPIREPVVKYGPFVMNTQKEIDQAIEDYSAGRLGSIPGKNERMEQTKASQAKQNKQGDR